MNIEETSLSDVSGALRRQLSTVVYVALPLLAIFVGIAFGLPDAYRSTAVIRIDQDLGRDNRAADTYAEYYVQTLTAQVFSSENLGEWVDEFNLYASEPDWGVAEKKVELFDNLATSIVMTPVIDPASGREREVVTGFEVSFTSHSARTAFNVATAAAEAFLVENRRSRQDRGQGEINFFKKESEVYRAQIAEVEARLAEFKENNSRRLPELMQVNMNAMERVERDLETSQLQIDNLKRERVILEAQLSQIPSTSDEAIEQLAALQNEYIRVSSIYQDTHPNVVSIRKQIDLLSKTVDSAAAIPILRKQQEEIAVALTEARERYSEDHPDVRQLVRSEDTIRERIAELGARAGSDVPEVASTNDLYVRLDTQIKAIDSQMSGLNGRIQELRAKRDEYEGLLLQTPQVERQYQELSRDLANARQLYEETQEKQREAELSLALTRGARGEQLVMAQAPSVPGSPTWPPRAAILVLGFILSPGIGVGIATLRELSSGTVRSSRDVFELCGTPPIALVPEMHNRNRRIMQRIYAAGFIVGAGAVGSLAYLGAQAL